MKEKKSKSLFSIDRSTGAKRTRHSACRELPPFGIEPQKAGWCWSVSRLYCQVDIQDDADAGKLSELLDALRPRGGFNRGEKGGRTAVGLSRVCDTVACTVRCRSTSPHYLSDYLLLDIGFCHPKKVKADAEMVSRDAVTCSTRHVRIGLSANSVRAKSVVHTIQILHSRSG